MVDETKLYLVVKSPRGHTQDVVRINQPKNVYYRVDRCGALHLSYVDVNSEPFITYAPGAWFFVSRDEAVLP